MPATTAASSLSLSPSPLRTLRLLSVDELESREVYLWLPVLSRRFELLVPQSFLWVDSLELWLRFAFGKPSYFFRVSRFESDPQRHSTDEDACVGLAMLIAALWFWRVLDEADVNLLGRVDSSFRYTLFMPPKTATSSFEVRQQRCIKVRHRS